MATFPYDDLTLNSLMQSLPELQRKKRRAEQLRQTQEHFREMGEEQPTGMMLPTQKGSMYETVSEYRPDYAGMANKGMGALGDWLTGRKAEEAQSGYDEDQTAALLGMSQQLSKPQLGNAPMGDTGAAGLDAAAADEARARGPMPTQDTLRLAMGMVGGPELKDYLPKDRSDLRVQSAFTDDAGKKILVMSDGSTRDTGKSADFGGQIVTDERNGLRYLVPKTGKFRGQYIPLGDYDAPDDLDANVTATDSGEPAVTGFDSAVTRLFNREGGLNPNDSGRGPSNFGINQSANPDVDVTSLTKETATPLYKERYWDAIDGDNIPATIQEAAFDAAVNMGPEVAKQLVAESGGDPMKFRELREARYDDIFDPSRHTAADRASWTRRNLETTGGGPKATGAAVSATGNVSGRPRALTKGEAKFAEEQAKAQSDAAAALGKVEGQTQSGLRAIDDLLGDPEALGEIVGNKDELLSYGRIPDALAQYAIPALSAGTPAARGFAKWKTVKGSAFLQAFEELRGGGQITEAEGTKAELAKAALDRSQSLEDVQNALRDLRDVVQAGYRRAKARARGDFSGDNALSVTMRAGMTSPTVAPALRPAATPKYNLPPGFAIED